MDRTDIHRPSAIVPSDYDFVAFECIKIEGLGDCHIIMAERAKIEAHMARTRGTYSDHAHGGNCMICGNVFATYTVLFYHAKTNTYVRAGQDCAMKLDMSDDNAFKSFTSGVRDAREARAGKLKAQTTLADLGLASAWDFVSYVGGEREEQTLRDMLGNLIRYGSWSEKQVNYARVLVERIGTRAERKAAQAAEAAAAPAWKEGRQIVTGVVVSIKWMTSPYPPFNNETLKGLIKLADGRKLWATIPSAFTPEGGVKGATITMAVNVKPKTEEPSFAFGSRPYLHPNPSQESK